MDTPRSLKRSLHEAYGGGEDTNDDMMKDATPPKKLKLLDRRPLLRMNSAPAIPGSKSSNTSSYYSNSQSAEMASCSSDLHSSHTNRFSSNGPSFTDQQITCHQQEDEYTRFTMRADNEDMTVTLKVPTSNPRCSTFNSNGNLTSIPTTPANMTSNSNASSSSNVNFYSNSNTTSHQNSTSNPNPNQNQNSNSNPKRITSFKQLSIDIPHEENQTPKPSLTIETKSQPKSTLNSTRSILAPLSSQSLNSRPSSSSSSWSLKSSTFSNTIPDENLSVGTPMGVDSDETMSFTESSDSSTDSSTSYTSSPTSAATEALISPGVFASPLSFNSLKYRIEDNLFEGECLNQISPETMQHIMRNESAENLIIIDCRFPHEFNGGHISGARNLFTPQDVERFLFGGGLSGDASSKVIVFHCEFSQKRGPKMFRHVRQIDRHNHRAQYPRLSFSEMYVLQGGYRRFHEECSQLCNGGYTPMHDDRYTDNLRNSWREMKRGWELARRNSRTNRSMRHQQMRRCRSQSQLLF